MHTTRVQPLCEHFCSLSLLCWYDLWAADRLWGVQESVPLREGVRAALTAVLARYRGLLSGQHLSKVLATVVLAECQVHCSLSFHSCCVWWPCIVPRFQQLHCSLAICIRTVYVATAVTAIHTLNPAYLCDHGLFQMHCAAPWIAETVVALVVSRGERHHLRIQWQKPLYDIMRRRICSLSSSNGFFFQAAIL
jgi:hypothetical protein